MHVCIIESMCVHACVYDSVFVSVHVCMFMCVPACRLGCSENLKYGSIYIQLEKKTENTFFLWFSWGLSHLKI